MPSKHALIIDDNDKNISVLTRLLNAEGVQSSQVTDPRTLDTVLTNIGKIDVIFLDLEMPMLDGFQVFDKLKANKNFQAVPIIAYTVHVSEITLAHKHGFDGFIGKPLDSEKFPNQLARILNGEHVWETA